MILFLTRSANCGLAASSRRPAWSQIVVTRKEDEVTMLKVRRLSEIAAVSVLSVLPMIAMAMPAQAVGDNRTVSRGCGQNYVSSGYYADGSTWAQTKKQSGDCKGRLSVAFELSDGYWTNRVYGDNLTVYSTWSGRARHGLHWGCDACNVTRS